VVRFSAFLVAVWIGCSALPATAGAEVQFPQAGRVGIEPPKGMVPMAGSAPGFIDPDTKAKIAILDLPRASYEEIQRSLFGPNSGLTVEKRESFPFEDGIGYLLTARAVSDGVPVRRWYFLATATNPAEDLVAFINVEIPVVAGTTYTEAMVRKALSTVSFRASPVDELISRLPFTMENLAGFRVMKALTGGVILTDGSTDDLTKQPYVIISVGVGAPEDVGDRGKFAQQMLASAPLRNLSITSGEAMRIGGRPGNEIRANAADLLGNPVSLVQWVRFNGPAFIRVIAVGKPDQWDQLFPRFRAIRDGVEPK
jgi:hypothetical protein